MNTAQAIRGTAYYALLLWLLYLVARAPRNVPLRSITVLVAGWAVGFPFGLAALSGSAFLVGDPMESQLVAYILSLVGQYGLVCFLLFTTRPSAVARRWAWWQLPLVILVAVILVYTALSTPMELRPEAARIPTDSLVAGYASRVPSIGAFYFFANAFTLYAYGFGLLVAAGYVIRGTDRQLHRGMILASVGLAGLTFCFAAAVVSNVFLWTGNSTKVPSAMVLAAMAAAYLGIPLFVAGVAYRSVAMRLAAVRVWWRHRRAYNHLEPLWSALHAAFPEDAFGRVPASRWRDVFSLRRVHRRYYRRAIECRDGLVQLSPYLAALVADADAVELVARNLPAALRAHAAGTPTASAPVPLILSQQQGLDADVAQLVALSQALHKP